MAKLSTLVLAGAAIVCVLTLSACASRPVGDFGRAAPDPIHDTVMPVIGKARAYNQHEPVSAFNLTDEEQEMRDRVWHYLTSPSAFDWFGDNIAELQRTRIVPLSSKPMRTDLYYNWLSASPYASSHTRYARINDDAKTDSELMPDVFASICAVLTVDRQRGLAANKLQLGGNVDRDAAARYDENHMVIGWFVRAARNRYDSYNYALEHLLVETPHKDAVQVNDQLNTLAAFVTQAEAGEFCSGLPGPRHDMDIPIRSRMLVDDHPVKGS